MAKKDPIYIKIDKGHIECSYRAYYKVIKGGKIAWFIPGFNIRFNSDNMEMGEKRAEKMVRYFMHFWATKGSFREFILEINRLGFKAPHHHEYTMSQLLRKKVNTATFSSMTIVPDSNDYQSKDFVVTSEAA